MYANEANARINKRQAREKKRVLRDACLVGYYAHMRGKTHPPLAPGEKPVNRKMTKHNFVAYLAAIKTETRGALFSHTFSHLTSSSLWLFSSAHPNLAPCNPQQCNKKRFSKQIEMKREYKESERCSVFRKIRSSMYRWGESERLPVVFACTALHPHRSLPPPSHVSGCSAGERGESAREGHPLLPQKHPRSPRARRAQKSVQKQSSTHF